MCGIFCAYGMTPFNFSGEVGKYESLAEKMDHLGSESRKIIVNNKVMLRHRRLPLEDSGNKCASQPFNKNGIFSVVDGRIYNSSYCKRLTQDHVYRSKSTREVIIPLYAKYGTQFVKYIQGMFAFVLYDSKKDLLIACVDIGMNQLFIRSLNDRILFSSSLKALPYGKQMPAGSLFIKSRHDNGSMFSYIDKIERTIVPYTETIKNKIIEVLESHMCENAVFIIDGYEGAVLAAIASRITDIQTVSSRDFYMSGHIKIEITDKEVVETIPEAVSMLETYDVEKIRKGIPMLVIAKKAGHLGKVFIAGCDSRNINKTFSVNGMELRTPFGDKRIRNYLDSLNKYDKGLLRSAFENYVEGEIEDMDVSGVLIAHAEECRTDESTIYHELYVSEYSYES